MRKVNSAPWSGRDPLPLRGQRRTCRRYSDFLVEVRPAASVPVEARLGYRLLIPLPLAGGDDYGRGPIAALDSGGGTGILPARILGTKTGMRESEDRLQSALRQSEPGYIWLRSRFPVVRRCTVA